MKQKKFLKALALCLCLTGTANALVACGPSGGPGGTSKSDKDLIVEIFGGGYGTDWLYSVANAFEKKTGNKVDITVQMGANGITNMTTSFKSLTSPTDIYFTKANFFADIYSGALKVDGVSYDCIYEDLTDLYNTEIEGEGILYKDKLYKNYEQYYNVNDKYYCTSWASGVMGIIVNMDVWNACGLTSFPRTTDELLEMVEVIKSKGKSAFICSMSSEYWTMIDNLWMAQYEGTERMQQIYDGYDADGNRYTEKLADFQGYYEMLKFYERILTPEFGNLHTASNDVDFTNMQGMFLQGAAAMCPNGDWIEREMSLNYQDANIEFMKSPIISALADRCSFANSDERDAKLRELVDYVDANASGYEGKPSWATNDDIDIVRDSRSIEVTAGAEHNAFIPCYSNNKDLAKEFLLYLATDEAMQIYRNGTGGCDEPFYWTNRPQNTSYSGFRQSVNDVTAKSELWIRSDKDKIYSLGGYSTYFYTNGYGTFVNCFTALEKKDRKTATEYYLKTQEYFQKNIQTLKQKAGL